MSFIFTIFAYVARHVELTRSSTVSTSTRNVLAAPCFASPFPSPTAGSRHSYHRQAGLTCQQCLSPPVNQSGNQSKGERSIHPSAQLDHNGKQSINEFVDFWLVFLFFTGNFVKYFWEILKWTSKGQILPIKIDGGGLYCARSTMPRLCSPKWLNRSRPRRIQSPVCTRKEPRISTHPDAQWRLPRCWRTSRRAASPAFWRSRAAARQPCRVTRYAAPAASRSSRWRTWACPSRPACPGSRLAGSSPR